MAYNDFTFDLLQERLGITIREVPGLFTNAPPVTVSDFLRITLERNMPLIGGIATEKARSEWIIAPLLSELREIMGRQISVFSGAEFTVDRNDGLVGFCDFLISRSPVQLMVQSPVITVVEAKREDLTVGVPQCVAEMVAARRFNARRNEPYPSPYGVITSGTQWRFLRLEGDFALVDTTDVFISEADRILGILVHMIQSADTPTAASSVNSSVL